MPCILKILILGLVAAKVFVQVDLNRKFTSFPFAFASNTTPPGIATVIITETLEDETISWYKKTRVTLPKALLVIQSVQEDLFLSIFHYKK